LADREELLRDQTGPTQGLDVEGRSEMFEDEQEEFWGQPWPSFCGLDY
jgi:hypothetical protein